jgi:hypothetical protein
MAGINPKGVQPTPGGPLDPSVWHFPKAGDYIEHGEKQRVGRAFTTVNADDFAIKPTAKTPEAD